MCLLPSDSEQFYKGLSPWKHTEALQNSLWRAIERINTHHKSDRRRPFRLNPVSAERASEGKGTRLRVHEFDGLGADR